MKRKTMSMTVMLLLSIGITALHAQQSTTTSGGNATGAGGKASYSVGQVVYTYNSGSNGSANQGVIQPYEFFTTGINESEDIKLSLSVFPNPTTAGISLSVENRDIEALSFEVYDQNGRLLLSDQIISSVTTVPMQQFANATYFLKVFSNKKIVKEFTLIKNN
jgi:hypothetical protein